LTDADGKGMAAPAPMLDESFLKSLTRNFMFNVYMRAGFMFNGNWGAGTFNFETPDNPGGRLRLGNENDFYTELILEKRKRHAVEVGSGQSTQCLYLK
jgi:maltoporin